MRIVRKLSPQYGGIFDGDLKLAYLKSDTIEIKPDWRPENFPDILRRLCDQCNSASSEHCLTCEDSIRIRETWGTCLESLEEL